MIRFDNVTAGFDGRTIFRDLHFDIPRGARIALMGPSGMGKTTLLRLMAGLMKPEKGKVTVNARKIAYLFQEDRLLPWETAISNVALSADRERAEHYLRLMEITDVNQYPKEMSGGMQRRVAIARVLAFEGDILLMDEPFKGLDEELKARVASVICEHADSIIMTTHDLREAEMLGCEVISIEPWVRK